MFIDVQMSNNEYNMGSNGLIMKTLTLPEDAQIFDEMIILDKMANGSNAGKICSNQSTSPFAAAFTVTAGYFNM